MNVFEISVEEVRSGLETQSLRLIDVRGPDEHERARIDGSTLISRELAEEMEREWAKDEAIVFYCHTGVRSLHAVHYFVQKGFTNVKSMAGGIEAWSIRVDPAVPRY